MYKKKNSWQKFWTERNKTMLLVAAIFGALESAQAMGFGILNAILFFIFGWQLCFWLLWFIFGDHSPANK